MMIHIPRPHPKPTPFVRACRARPLVAAAAPRVGMLAAALSAGLAAVFASAPAASGAVIENTADFVGKALAKGPDEKYKSQLDFKDVLPFAGPTADELTLLDKAYNKKPLGPQWTFKKSAAPAPGKLRIMEHQAFARNTVFGADLSVLYDDGVAEARNDYSWIQIVYADNWDAKGKSAAHSDSSYTDTPFYSNYTPQRLRNGLKTPTDFYNLDAIWLNSTDYPQQKLLNPTGAGKVPAGDLLFEDEPYVNDARFASNGAGYCHISFHLYLVSYTWNDKVGKTAKGEITIYDGMSWGVTVVPAPSTLALLAGCAGLIGARRRR